MDSYGKVILGVLAGFAAGAVLGILFAPDKGEVTRQRLSDRAKEFGEDIEELSETVKGQVSRISGDVKEKIGHYTKAGASREKEPAL